MGSGFDNLNARDVSSASHLLSTIGGTIENALEFPITIHLARSLPYPHRSLFVGILATPTSHRALEMSPMTMMTCLARLLMKTVPLYLFLICDTTLAIILSKISMIQAWVTMRCICCS